MERKRIKIACVGLGISGLIVAIITCALPSWKISSFTGYHIVMTWVHEGLWMGCAYQSTSQYRCKTYDSQLTSSTDLQAARAMTVVCCIVSAISLLLVTCTTNEDTKPKIFLAAGVGMIIAGLLLIIPVSWAANNILRDSNKPLLSIHIQLGPCIFIGWAGGLFLLLDGGLLCCFSRLRSGGTGGTATYHSNIASAPAI